LVNRFTAGFGYELQESPWLGGKLGQRTVRSTEQSKEVHFFYTLNYTHLPSKLKYLKSRLAKDDNTTGHRRPQGLPNCKISCGLTATADRHCSLRLPQSNPATP